MKKITIGVVAHVDAGKTTLHEAMLFQSGVLSSMGRVDHKNTFLDYDSIEKKRGITVYSKETIFKYKDVEFTTIDTPGHIDFSHEMERALQVLDYAILVISGVDTIQSHTLTILELLKHYKVPTYIFVNKMDITTLSKEQIIDSIEKATKTPVSTISQMDEDEYEKLALLDDEVLDEYMETQSLTKSTLKKLINRQLMFPVQFGSALHNDGVDMLLDSIISYSDEPVHKAMLEAFVYKITHDDKGNRLTHVKIYGGELVVKQKLSDDEKIDQIRLYSGNTYEVRDKVCAGSICVLKGLKKYQVGDIIGGDDISKTMQLEALLNYRVLFNEKDISNLQNALQILQDENPSLKIIKNKNNEIEVSLMGQVQQEILKYVLKERFSLDVTFTNGSILYKESILNKVTGVGHFEPLRHYAEVVLLLEPIEDKNKFIVNVNMQSNGLEKQHQNQIINILKRNLIPGVLTRHKLSGIKVTLIDGKTHPKHTEGGDLLEATKRAMRHGLLQANSILLEPYIQFTIVVGSMYLSKIIYDIESRNGEYQIIEDNGIETTIQGSAPLVNMQEFTKDLAILTKSSAKYFIHSNTYKQCNNQEEIISKMNYHPLIDIDFPSSSIFCKNGTGFQVDTSKVFEYMHCKLEKERNKDLFPTAITQNTRYASSDEELEAIFVSTYGKKDIVLPKQQLLKTQTVSNYKKLDNYILVDGYNVIHALDETKKYLPDNMDMARNKIIDIFCDYQGYKSDIVVVVFDAYKVKGSLGSYQKHDNIHIVYTKEAQSADNYIEKVTGELKEEYNVQVITDDRLEQTIIMAKGGQKLPVSSFYKEYLYLKESSKEFLEDKKGKHHYALSKSDLK